jgi:NADPH-dependent 2,4-dienoyl-CoA reductase/sulfur reductase-like enzyme/nitrite reductase/ring-hydroxylating ferredoxin subunit
MGENASAPQGPDFSQGVELQSIRDGGVLSGRVADETALAVRRGSEVYIIGASCTHYHGPLAEGLVAGDTIRCPWHHACFDLRSGRALRAPALDPVPAWRVEQIDGKFFARERLKPSAPPRLTGGPKSIVIIGGGAAGLAAAATLREEGYEGPLKLVSADPAAPYDRPNLSKDYLAGTAPEEWLPLRDEDFYKSRQIDLRLGARVKTLLIGECAVELETGERLSYDALLLATGADPVRLSTPGADSPHVHYLRSLADSRALIAAAKGAKRAVVIGASFIGLEAAASLRSRGLEVRVVAPEQIPMARILGPELGAYVRSLHEARGVAFHLGQTVASISKDAAILANGETVPADLVVIGVGVRPSIGLAEAAGLKIDNGVLVDEFLETSAAGVFAAGDIARWPDMLTGQRIRVEHWVVAERQGQTAARNMLGRREPFAAVPFFWSQHYDSVISYVGHAAAWDRTEITGKVEDGDCMVEYFHGVKKVAAASVSRDLESLRMEAEFERSIAAAPRPLD